jgi:hypothetical protein
MMAVKALLLGVSHDQVAELYGVSRRTLSTWVNRFNSQGIDGLIEQPRSGRPLKIRPEINYDIITIPFRPDYMISQIKPASLLPDRLPKLYKSFVNFGLGNYNSPLAEISITNERSKQGAIGFYGRHYSSNGNVKLDNGEKAYAGYMDNDLSVFGKKFFRKSTLDGSVDFSQKIRYAYGYDTSIFRYEPPRKVTRLGYTQLGANLGFASNDSDSSKLSYDFNLDYNYFYQSESMFSHNPAFSGKFSKSYKGFYAGTGFEFDYYGISPRIWDQPKYIASINPSISKNTGQWNFRLGLKALLDRNLSSSANFHVYPDINFGFSIVPSYMEFFAGLGGDLEKNTPESVIAVNPFILPDGRLFKIPNTDNALVVFGGLKGNNGINGNYLLSASYSVVNDLIFYSNLYYPDSLFLFERGNHFIILPDNGEVLNIHGEMSGKITDKLSFLLKGDYFSYNLARQAYAWNRPEWQAGLGFKYNLRDKIIAGAEFTGLGKRKEIVTRDISTPVPLIPPTVFEFPAHINLNLSAEYRYTKILSFWLKLNNISYNRYYEWAFYPSQRFMGMIGFTYSL